MTTTAALHLRQESVYSLAEHLRAFHAWSTRAIDARTAPADNEPAVQRFFELNQRFLAEYEFVMANGWSPAQPDVYSSAIRERALHQEIAERLGRLTIVEDMVYSVYANDSEAAKPEYHHYFLMVHASKTDRKITFTRPVVTTTAENTLWRPTDMFCAIARLKSQCNQLLVSADGLPFRDREEMLASWWLGGPFWRRMPALYVSMLFTQRTEQPPLLQAIFNPKKRARKTPVKSINALAIQDLIDVHGATIMKRGLIGSEQAQLNEKALNAMFLNPTELEPWSIVDAVWLELAVVFRELTRRRSARAAPSIQAENIAGRKVLVGRADKLGVARDLLDQFSALCTYDVLPSVEYAFSNTTFDTQHDETLNLAYIVLTWNAETVSALAVPDKPLMKIIKNFQTLHPKPWITYPLELLRAWANRLWELNLRSVEGKKLVETPAPLYYWTETAVEFGAQPCAQAKFTLDGAAKITFLARNLTFTLLRPAVMPVPFTFLYYAANAKAIDLLEPTTGERRTALRELLKRMQELPSLQLMGSALVKLADYSKIYVTNVSEQGATQVARKQKKGSGNNDDDDTSVTDNEDDNDTDSTGVDADDDDAGAAPSQFNVADIAEAQRKFRDMLLARIIDSRKVTTIAIDQSTSSPIYQRVFFVYTGENACFLNVLANKSIVK